METERTLQNQFVLLEVALVDAAQFLNGQPFVPYRTNLIYYRQSEWHASQTNDWPVRDYSSAGGNPQ